MSREEILSLLKESTSEKEWNSVCDRVKELCRNDTITDCSGDYPSWWFKEVVLSGLAHKVSTSWI